VQGLLNRFQPEGLNNRFDLLHGGSPFPQPSR
jgi:hypothetical protein